MIKKELTEETVSTFDLSKSTLSSVEIDELITTLSLNIIKTREVLKETFDEYIITLISFDKIKDKIKFLKTKNDESFNDCSPVFSKKFKLISNMEKNLNDNKFGMDSENIKFNNINNNTNLSADGEHYSNKLSQISNKTETRNKFISNAALQENFSDNFSKDNSAEKKSANEANENNYLSNNNKLDRKNKQAYNENKINYNNINNYLNNDAYEKLENRSLCESFDSNTQIDEEYQNNEINSQFESFAGNYKNTQIDENYTNANAYATKSIQNQLQRKKKVFVENACLQKNNCEEETEKDYYINEREQQENRMEKNKNKNFKNVYKNLIQENRNENQPEFDNENSFCNKREINEENIDINSLYLDSIQEEEFQVYKSKYHSSNSGKEQNKANKHVFNQANFIKDTSKTNEIRKNLDKSEAEFKKNFPMKFYRHFQTENNNCADDRNTNYNDSYIHTDQNALYKRNKKQGNSCYMTQNVKYKNPDLNNLSDLESKSIMHDSQSFYNNFDKNNFSAISSELNLTNLKSNKNRNKNKSCDFTSETKKVFDLRTDETCGYYDNYPFEDKTLSSNLNVSEVLNDKNIENNQMPNKANKKQRENNKANFISPLKKRVAKAPILNTGNKIRKMNYFDHQSNNSLLIHKSNKKEVSLEKDREEESENEQIYSDIFRKSLLDNACIYSLESNSVLRTKNKVNNTNNPLNEHSKQSDIYLNKANRSSTFNSNVMRNSTGETFNPKSFKKTNKNNNNINNHNDNKCDLLESEKTLPLDFANNSNLQNFKNSKAIINESNNYLLTNNSNRNLNSSKAANPENLHIDVVRTSTEKLNKSSIQNNKNKISKENLNYNSVYLQSVDKMHQNSLFSEGYHALTEINKNFNDNRNIEENNDVKRSYRKISNTIRHDQSSRDIDRSMLSTGEQLNFNKKYIKKSDVNNSSKHPKNSFDGSFIKENQENIRPNYQSNNY